VKLFEMTTNLSFYSVRTETHGHLDVIHDLFHSFSVF